MITPRKATSNKLINVMRSHLYKLMLDIAVVITQRKNQLVVISYDFNHNL